MNTICVIGDRVRYESAAGTIRGEVVDIYLGRNAREEMIKWVMVEYTQHNRACKIPLAESALGMMKFQVNFRDVDFDYDSYAGMYVNLPVVDEVAA